MKNKFLTASLSCFVLLLIASCGGDSDGKKDSDANNISAESAPDSNTTSSGDSKSGDEGDQTAVSISSEDMSVDNSQIIELPYDKLNDAVSAILSKQNKALNTVNEDGSIYVIASSSTGIPSNRNGFINSRNIAFAKAELRAKMEVLRMAGEVVTSERNSSLVSNSVSGADPEGKEKAGALEKAAKVVDKSLDKALKELGMSDGEIQQMNASEKEKAYNETFYNYVSSYVASMIKGISVVKIVEGEVGSNDYEVAVCVKYSPENQSIAGSLDNLGANKGTLNSSVVGNLKSMDQNKLVSKLGAQFFKDENGKIFVLGFGQASVRKTESRQSNFINIARKKARLKAVDNIKNLIAEDLVGKEISENIEKIVEYKDGGESIYTEDNFSELIKSKRSSVKLNTLVLRNWDAVHPVSNSRIIGSIVILTESNNINFNSTESGNKTKDGKTQKSEYFESESLEGEEF